MVFYVTAALIVWGLSKLNPNAQDGGPGLGSLALIVLGFIIALLAVVNFYRGFKRERFFLIIGLLHLLILLTGIYFLLF